MGAHQRTVGDLLRAARAALAGASVPSAALEGELLVAHVLGVDRARLLASLRDALPAGAVEHLNPLLERRCSREPLAYITGHREFYGRDFAVDARVLVPRPETELLVERGLRVAGRLGREGFATDSSTDALDVAKANGEVHGIGGRVTWLLGALCAPLSGRFDVVVANLPYVCTGALRGLQPEISHEPEGALDGGPDGMRHIGPFIRELPDLLTGPGAAALIEIDPPIEKPVAGVAREAMPDAEVRVWSDLDGLARCAEITVL